MDKSKETQEKPGVTATEVTQAAGTARISEAQPGEPLAVAKDCIVVEDEEPPEMPLQPPPRRILEYGPRFENLGDIPVYNWDMVLENEKKRKRKERSQGSRNMPVQQPGGMNIFLQGNNICFYSSHPLRA